MREAARGPQELKIWLKLDAGTEGWYRGINRSSIPLETLLGKIREFAGEAPVIIQTMVCKLRDLPPPPGEAEAWEAAGCGMVSGRAGEGGSPGGGVQGVQIYGKARPAPEDPLTMALDEFFLQARALSLKEALKKAGRGFR